jgi:NADH-quinone oxidoreductase subunit A
MRGQYGTILVFLIFGAGLVFVSILISRLIQPRNPSPEKLATYECGEEAVGEARIQYNFRFYSVALAFIIFEAEILFMFPWAIVYVEHVRAGQGLMTFIKMLIFIGILFLGLVYAWAKGDLDWVKARPAFTAEDVDMPPQAIFKHHQTATPTATISGE